MFQETKMAADTADIDIIEMELENCTLKIKEENEGAKQQLANLNIHVIPEDVRNQSEAIADFQMLHKIDEMDDISIELGVSESILRDVKQAALQRELKSESRRLHHQKNQLNKGMKMLMRDEKLYKEEKQKKEETNAHLKSENILLQPELEKCNDALAYFGIQENPFNSSLETIKDLHRKLAELDEPIQVEESYLLQFGGLPPSLSEAAKLIQSMKEEMQEVDVAIRKVLTQS